MINHRRALLRPDEIQKYALGRTAIVLDRLKRVRSFLAKVDDDLEVAKRKEELLCCGCYYDYGRIAGQAFTTTNCRYCDVDITFPTTDTDTFCRACAELSGLCRHCGADLELKQLLEK